MLRDDEAITELLKEWSSGDPSALDRLVIPSYTQLRRLARKELGLYGRNSLSPATLVHEAYLRLRKSVPPKLENRNHFYAMSARLMRFILVDYLRAQGARKRGGVQVQLTDLPDESGPSLQHRLSILDIDAALDELAKLDARSVRIVELRYFSGLSLEETASAADLSVAEVKRKWTFAKAWIQKWLSARETRQVKKLAPS